MGQLKASIHHKWFLTRQMNVLAATFLYQDLHFLLTKNDYDSTSFDVGHTIREIFYKFGWLFNDICEGIKSQCLIILGDANFC